MNAHVKKWFGYFVSDLQPGQEFTIEDVREYINNRSPKNTPSSGEISHLIKTDPRIKKSDNVRRGIIVWVIA